MGKRRVQLQKQTKSVNLSDVPKHQTLQGLLCKTGRAQGVHTCMQALGHLLIMCCSQLLQYSLCICCKPLGALTWCGVGMVWVLCGYHVGMVWVLCGYDVRMVWVLCGYDVGESYHAKRKPLLSSPWILTMCPGMAGLFAAALPLPCPLCMLSCWLHIQT